MERLQEKLSTVFAMKLVPSCVIHEPNEA